MLSPELALVDAELATAARAALRTHDVFAALERCRTAERATQPAKSPRRLPKLVVGVAVAGGLTWTALALVGRGSEETTPKPVAAPASASARAAPRAKVVPHRAAPARSIGVAATHGAARPQPATRPAHHVAPAAKPKPKPAPHHTAPPTTVARVLSWPKQRHARYYRVQVFAAGGGTFLFEVWTSQPRLPLPSTWMDGGRRRRLETGSYRWLVFPVFGRGRIGAGTSPARPVARGTFAVDG